MQLMESSGDDDIDLELLSLNLSLSPTKRLEAHQMALDILLEIDEARTRLDAKSQQSS